MSEAPERIWADMDGCWWDKPYGESPEYVRCDMLQEIFARYSRVEADRIEELEAKLAECEARLGKAVDVLQWQSDAIRKSISGNEVGRNRVLLNGVYHEGPVVNWVFEILAGFETINLTTIAELTGGKDGT